MTFERDQYQSPRSDFAQDIASGVMSADPEVRFNTIDRIAALVDPRPFRAAYVALLDDPNHLVLTKALDAAVIAELYERGLDLGKEVASRLLECQTWEGSLSISAAHGLQAIYRNKESSAVADGVTVALESAHAQGRLSEYCYRTSLAAIRGEPVPLPPALRVERRTL